jgi:mRNA interferase RelE/StbE
MLDYKVSPKAEKFFKKIKDKSLKNKFKNAIREIREDPYIGEPKKGNLKGILGYDFRYNNTIYEIAYEVANIDGKVVVIILAGTRENFDKELEKYIKSYKNKTE